MATQVINPSSPSLKAWLLSFIEVQWSIVLLFILMMILAGTHAFMIHYNRPPSVIQWNEGMITGCFSAIVAKLK